MDEGPGVDHGVIYGWKGGGFPEIRIRDVAGQPLDRARQFDLIQRLNPLDRQIIVSYLEGLDAAATAEITGLSSANVAVNVTVGGDAGAGSTSGVVLVDSRHNIVTIGNHSNGILAQSLAGGAITRLAWLRNDLPELRRE